MNGLEVVITPVVPGGPAPLTVLLGSAPASPTSDGGWAIVNRPKNTGFTAWEGNAPHQMNLNVMFDGFADGISQEAKYNSLFYMMRHTRGPAQQPSPVRLSGPVPLTNVDWVIQGIEPDTTTIIRADNGNLLRIAVTISLLEYIEADVLVAKVQSPAIRVFEKMATITVLNGVPTGAAPVTSGRTHTVKVGDTLWAIAQKELGAGKRYTEIAALNGIRNPNSVPVGTVLKIP